MHLKLIAPLCAAVVLSACDFKASVTVPKITQGLSVSEHGLKPKETLLLANDIPVTDNTLLYGRQLGVRFSGVEGFVKEKSAIFPGMSILVTNTKGDTAYYTPDAYPPETYPRGVKIDPVDLTGWINLAGPVHSGGSYMMKLHVWDKKGKTTLDATQKFKVIANPKLKHQTHHLSYNEIYMYDQDKEALIADTIRLGQQVHFVYDGVQGFSDQNGFYDLKVDLLATDATGRVVFKDDDLTKGELLPKSDVDAVLAPSLKFTKGNLQNPVTIEVSIKDKNNGASIKTQTELILK